MKIINYTFFILFSLLVCLSFWDVLSLKTTFLNGDYSGQFYPWSSFYSQSIKNFTFPLWTRYIQSGFPLFAEGQVGMIYPFNIVLFFILPFSWAYNYSFLFHFILAGIFMYLYSRKIGCSVSGGCIAAITLCFGTAYAGGSINISTVKSLCYFPLILLIFEKYFDSDEPRFKHFLIIGMLWGMQILAGSLQMTFYSIIFAMIYVFYRAKLLNKNLFIVSKGIIISSVVALLISLPQLYYTFELANLSNRASTDIGFSLWNSFSPLGLTGTFLPLLGSVFLRNNVIYIGILSMFFVIVALLFLRKDNSTKPMLLILIVGLFIIFGKFNPLYVGLIKLFKLYYFRGPAKAAYFVSFALSIIAAKGFTHFFSNREEKINRAVKIFIYSAALIIITLVILNLVFAFFRPQLINAAKEYTLKNIYGASFHKFDLTYYMNRAENTIASLSGKVSLHNPMVIYGLFMLIISVALIILILKIRSKRIAKISILSVIFLDLLFLSFYFEGPRTATARYERSSISYQAAFNILDNDKSLYRICPFGKKDSLPSWAYFNDNMIYGIDSIGIYSPLINNDYYKEAYCLGVVDDSLGAIVPEKEAIGSNRKLLEILNVKYIITPQELNYSFLNKVIQDGDVYIYSLNTYYPRFWFSEISSPENIVNQELKIEEYKSGYAKIKIETDRRGLLVFSEKYYPGWQAFIDGKSVKISKVLDVIQAIEVLPGKHNVVFKFQPKYLALCFLFQISAFLVLAIFIGYKINYTRR